MSGTVGDTTLSVEQIASHKHTLGVPAATGGGAGGYFYMRDGAGYYPSTQNTGGSQPHTHTLDGASGEANGLPPYYALSYIMRTA